jgi:hypothetical protein
MRRILFRLVPAIHVFIYRFSRGAVGSQMVGLQIFLLTTTGRKTGKKRTTPLGSFQDNGGLWLWDRMQVWISIPGGSTIS